ncbi:protein distal antenna isoform X1 [Culex pipiens pallens]|uniref:protein distal antenna isoform X1 n=1 Tax=Culex pipiens pallens TaxID=42434 RepID=UPI0022AA448A|nr:protein distal antenna isoform X1 [Culex pipiens pallens]
MMMATKGKRPLRHLTATDKIDAIQRIHDGESKASVARDIGVPESTLRGWCKNEEKLRYMSRQSAENADKLTSEATAAALTAVAAAELFNGPPEKRMKLEQGLFGKKYDESFYKSPRGMNGLDLSGGGDKGLGVSGGDIIMNGLHGADFSAFAKTAAEISAMGKAKDRYGADLSRNGGGDPGKAELSMAAISPLTSLSHLSGMGGLAQSPLALSFNEIATNLNLIAQLNNNHNLATMSNLGGLTAAQSLRNARPKGNASQSPRASLPDSSGSGGGTPGDKSTPSLTVRNLAKLQQKTSSELQNNGMIHGINLNDKYKQQSPSAAPLGRDPNAPVDEALWYWLKSQQAMLGLNNLYSQMPRPSSPQQPQSTPPTNTTQQQQPQSSTPPTATPPIVSTPQPTPPSSAPSLTPEDTKNSSWFWQWYKTFGASLMPGDKSCNNNSINATNANNSKYENILYSQLTKGQSPPTTADSLNNNAQPINLNISSNGVVDHLKSEPEDLSTTTNPSMLPPEDHTRFNPSPSTSIKSELKPEVDEVDEDEDEDDEVAKCNGANTAVKQVLDNLLYSQSQSPGPVATAPSPLSPSSSTHENGHATPTPLADDLKSTCSEDTDLKSSAEAVEHGEKFLKWLEACSDPNVTAMQVMQFKYLLNSIKLSAERQNGGGEERTRRRRK